MTIHTALRTLETYPAFSLDDVDTDLAQDGLDEDFDAIPEQQNVWSMIGIKAAWPQGDDQ